MLCWSERSGQGCKANSCCAADGPVLFNGGTSPRRKRAAPTASLAAVWTFTAKLSGGTGTKSYVYMVRSCGKGGGPIDSVRKRWKKSVLMGCVCVSVCVY